MIVMVTVSPSTLSKRNLPPPEVVMERPVLRVTVTPSIPVPSIETWPTIEQTDGDSAI